MPNVNELIDLRDRAAKAQRAAAAAEANKEAAVEKTSLAQDALSAARKTLTKAKSKLDEIDKAVAQIPVTQADLQITAQALADITVRLTTLDINIVSVEAEVDHYRHTLPYIVPPALLANLEQLRQERQALEHRQRELKTAMAEIQTRLTQLQAEAERHDAARQVADDAASEVKYLEDELAQLERAAQTASAQATAAMVTAQTLAAQLQIALDQLIAGLKPEVPIALLPVRLETRFHRPTAGQPPSELWIRVYPDDVHKDTHESGLTDAEEKWGKHFWRETWRAGLAPGSDASSYPQWRAQELGAWQQLAALFGPRRAAYIARQLEPSNKDSRPEEANTDPKVPLEVEPDFDPIVKRASSWTRAARARALPDRWLAIGYRQGDASNTKWGELIPATLNTGFDPNTKIDPSAVATESTAKVSVDPGMRWMVEFEEAVAKGMGIRMALSADEATEGFDRLIVLGVKGTLNDPKDGARELRELIEAHRFTWGCGFIPQGTPTNNTETVSSGYSREDVGFQTSFALEREQLFAASKDSDSRLATLAFGLDLSDLAHLRNADGHDQQDAANLNRGLWPTTIGYFLDQFFKDVLPRDDKDKKTWHDYFVHHVRARGPLPALRFGRQPYGVLPVSSLNRWASNSMVLVDLLKSLRNLWRTSQKAVAFAGRDSTKVGLDLVETLGLEAISSSYSWRWARGPRFLDLFWQLPGQQVDSGTLEMAGESLYTQVREALQRAGFPAGTQSTRLAGTTFARVAFQWTGPLVEAGPVSETQPLKYNYLSALADKDVSLDDIHNESGRLGELFPPDQPKPLLYLLLRQATLLAYAEHALPSWPRQPGQPRTPMDPPWFEPELVDMDWDLTADQPGDTFNTPTFWRVLKFVPPGKSISLGDALRSQGSAVGAPLSEFLLSLEQLADLPTAALERLLGETLDLASHRLDAWITSLATHRLTEMRKNQPTGIYLGGYGWVENLRPRKNQSLSDGYVHAPSISQATAAAVLRSGYLTHKDQLEGARLEMDLSSKRVRLALEFLDGVRQGQPLGALLGYRFERILHDKDLKLNSVIGPLRELAPLVGKLVQKDTTDLQEAIAANNVVDGLKLLELYQKDKNIFGKFSQEKYAIEAALMDIKDAVDAIGDLGIAEGVYQAVQGNYLRAGATLDAISRGETPGEIQVIKTPQLGVSFTQRLVALFNALPPQTTLWDRSRARAKAEPVLNAWAEQMLGDPEHVRCKAQYFNTGQDHLKDVPDDTADLNLKMLNLCALDLLYSPAVTNEARQTELELLMAREAMSNTTRPTGILADATVRLVFARGEDFQKDELTFPELFELVRTIRELITNGRALDSRDLTLAGAGGDPRIETELLNDQIKHVMDAWLNVKQTLESLFDVDQLHKLDKLKSAPFNVPPDELVGTKVNLIELVRNPNLLSRLNLLDISIELDTPTLSQLENLRDALEGFSAFAVQNAVPRSYSGDTPEARRDLVIQAQGVYSQVLDIDKRMREFPGSSMSDILAKLAVFFGEGFRVLLPFTLGDQHDLQAAMQRRERAGDAAVDKVIPWVQTVATVRDGARRLGQLLTYSEALGTGESMTIRVAQFPFDESDAWNLPNGPTEKTGATSIIIYKHGNLDVQVSQPYPIFAGLMLDEWVEVIPNRTLQTALAFHYDAPGACAPQAILLAIPPDSGKAWDVSTLKDILNETLDLAKLRTVDYDALSNVGHFLPALLIAKNIGGDPHGDTISSVFSN